MTRALCPNCARLAIREVLHAQAAGSNIREATYLCEQSHLFSIRWVENTPLTSGNGKMEATKEDGSGGNRSLTAKTGRSPDGCV